MNGLDSLYQQLILDHAKRPVGKRDFTPQAGDKTASHHEFNPSCGDEITLSIAVDDADMITEIAWQGDGCSISMASASALSQLVAEDGLSAQQALERIAAFREMLQSRGQIEPDEELLGDGVAFQGVSKFVMRVKCAMLAWVALEADLKKLGYTA